MRADPWLLRHPPSRIARWLLAMPLLFYVCHLGWMLGRRFVVVVHRGRITGRIHRSVVEVVRYDASTREVMVMTPWPTKVDWYRNIQADAAGLSRLLGWRMDMADSARSQIVSRVGAAAFRPD